MMDSIEKRAAQWAATGNTGMSSKAILAVMVGKPQNSNFNYPHDDGDLGRCIGLLDAVPEYRLRFGEMASQGPEWGTLVTHWEELERMWRAKDDGLYKRMKAILDPVEAANPNIIKFGSGAILHRGR